MLLVDANVLLYAVNRNSSRHPEARRWIDRALVGDEPVGLAWIALLAFLRLSSRPGVFPQPLSVEQALDVMDRWLEAPAAVTLGPTARHAAVLGGLLRQAGSGGNLTSDAHLAALGVEHGATIITFDRDFDRFLGVRWAMPPDE